MRAKHHVSVCFVACLLVLFSWPVPSSAQTAAAQLTGAITDPSGGTVAGAHIVARNVDTSVVTSATSGVNGYYTIPLLPPGRYEVTVTNQGFRTVTQTGITLNVSQSARIDFRMDLGAVAEAVRVEASASLVQTEDSTVGTLIENKRILDLPLNGRDVFSLTSLAPGVNPTGGGNTPHIAGSQSDTGEVQIDGATDIVPNTLAGENGYAYEPQVDAVQEFTVQVNGLPAEYGRFAGGVINVVTKSGTNSLHGTGFDFARNDVMAANDFFRNEAGIAKPGFSRYQYGGTVGGPIWIPKIYNGKNKTFFFFGYEKTDLANAAFSQFTVPTAAQRTGDFSGLKDANGVPISIYDPSTGHANPNNPSQWIRDPFPGNIIPASALNQTGAKVMGYYPLPNATPTNPYTNTNNFLVSGTSPANGYKIDSRLDQNWTEKWRTFVRVSKGWTNSNALNYWNSPATPGFGAVSDGDVWSGALDTTLIFSPTLIGDIRYSLGRTTSLSSEYGQGFDVAKNLGMAQYMQSFAQIQGSVFPYITMGNAASGMGQYFGDSTTAFTSHNINASLTKIWGAHTIKGGGEFRKQLAAYYQPCCSTGWYPFGRQFTQQEATTFNPNQGYELADLLLGLPDNALTASVPRPAFASGYYGMYIQDDWKVTRKLTLNVGLRYEITTPHTERYNNLSYWDPNIPSPIAGQVQATPDCPACGHLMGAMVFTDAKHRTQAPIDWSNIGPRFGFAYSPASKWVVRGGYAITFPPSEWTAGGASVGEEGFSLYNYWQPSWDGGRTFNTNLTSPFPNGIAPPPGNSAGASTNLGSGIGDSFFGIPSVKGPTEYIQQWNFNIQRSLPGQWLVEAGYLGMHGLNLINGSSQTGSDNFDMTAPQYLSLGSQLSQYVSNPLYGHLPVGSPLDQPTVPLAQLLKPYPQYTGLTLYRRPEGSMEYHALTIRVEKRFSHDMSFLASYTAGKEIDNGPAVIAWWEGNGAVDPGGVSNHYNLGQDRSVSPFDVSQRLVLSYVFELPFGRGKAFANSLPKLLNGIVSGWQFNGISTFQTGTPIVILGLTGTTGLGNIVNRPNANGQDPSVSHPTLEQWFKTSVFSPAPNYTFGTAPRTLPNVRNPGVELSDLSLFKNTYFGPDNRFNVQFRFEAFNAFNTPQFGPAGSSLGSGNFGQITYDSLPPRQLQLALKFLF